MKNNEMNLTKQENKGNETRLLYSTGGQMVAREDVGMRDNTAEMFNELLGD